MASAIGNRRWDVAVVGAGVWGLATARAALARGLSVIVLEAATVAAGASGGVVGALSPHAPDRWTGKKAFQLRALLAGRRYWPALETGTGLATGYAACGRLMPLQDAAARDQAEARAAEAARNWGAQARWQVVETVPGWLAAAPFGAVHETLSARLFPRAACAALARAVRLSGGAIREATPVRALAPGMVSTDAGTVRAGTVVVAAGVAGFGLLGIAGGRGVKGQAALLQADTPAAAPLVFADGIYVVPQPGGLVAVGSTSENRWADPAPDARLEAVIARARALVPALADAPVRERWAGIRPRAPRPDPMLGPVPGLPGVLAALGGFKIGFGLAPLVAETLADMIAGGAPDLPADFAAAAQIRA
ncbi:FAD-dependent oxidoreductase [Rhodobacteraceae bacterium 2CG4]|uniref:FAD-dependent oxidoreductase n=1 Tax=Halovulum marinum TaxID=2662447 RepID=A0A6L5YXQ9_9RHOB|nr:FAD-dependent oxidoreductase [Halovulum marinum]MSU88605.1 FAD-dependent oxidoreductase [Halovulum marinum]